MTIVVGMVATDGVVVAADSQAGSFRGVRVKRTDYTKIYQLSTDEGGVKAILAGAGEVAFINKAVNVLKAEWEHKKFTAVSEVEEAVETAMVTLSKKYFYDRAQILGVHEDIQTTKIRTKKGFQGPPVHIPGVHLLIGAMDKNGDKLLATVGPDGIAETEDTYTSIGSGSAYAEYLMSRIWSDNLDIRQALECA